MTHTVLVDLMTSLSCYQKRAVILSPFLLLLASSTGPDKSAPVERLFFCVCENIRFQETRGRVRCLLLPVCHYCTCLYI